MDEDGLSFELFATIFGPDECENDTHEEDDDGSGRIGDSGGEGNTGCGDEGGTVSEFLGSAEESVYYHRAKNFAFTLFNDCMIATTPFWNRIDDDEIGDAFCNE